MKHYVYIAMVAGLAGCQVADSPLVATDYDIGVGAASAALAAQGSVAAPIEPDRGTHAREACPTQGWITQGDGHRTRCPECRPLWEARTERLESWPEASAAIDLEAVDEPVAPLAPLAPTTHKAPAITHSNSSRRGRFRLRR